MTRALRALLVGGLAVCLQLATVSPASATEREFKGKIGRSYEESEEWWPERVRPPKGAPNVIIFLLDDTGFAQIGSFGGS